MYLFSKIFVSKTESELEQIQSDQEKSDEEEFFYHKKLQNDADVNQFLSMRLSILIKSTDIGIQNCPRTANGLFISRLLLSERNLLQSFLNFLSNK